MRFRIGSMSRGALGLALGMAALALPAHAQDKTLVISGSGGVVAEANAEIFIPVFEKETGWTARQVAAEGKRVAEIEAMVKAGKTVWDVSEISASDYPIAAGKGLLEPIDYSIVDPDNKLPAAARKEFGVVAASYSTVLVQRQDKNPEGKKMESWADFWDVETFPGPRSLNSKPQYNLEFALLADGVAAGSVYPCDFDRAFRSLDKVARHVDVWWTTGAQVEQMLGSGEVDMVATWASRAQSAQANGVPVQIVWHQNIWGCDNWSILKGTPNAAACREFIKFASDPKRQAELVKYFPAGMTQPEAFNYVKPEVARNCPTFPENIKSGVQINAKFWQQNQSVALERFNRWILT